MIVTLFFNLIILIVGSIFSLPIFPEIKTLPTIFGFDIDTALVNGMGYVHTLFNTFWVLGIMFNGFLFLGAYYIGKLVLQFFLGHRAPH